MKTKFHLRVGRLTIICCAVLSSSVYAQDFPINIELAQTYFQEAEIISNKDNGQLWQIPLYGPMLLVDPESRSVIANQADLEGNLTKRGNLFVGQLPKEQTIANTATKWAGVEWTMIVWPLPADEQDRAKLMVHELFHRIQGRLGLPGSNPANSHLDTRDGRIWLQLEWRALEAALVEQGLKRRKAIEDVLAFREYRRSLFPASPAQEDALELNEGLAEYTGLKLGSGSNAEFVLSVGCGLRQSRRRPSFVRSFAYASGPAYGALLDQIAAGWRQRIKAGSDLGYVLQKALSIGSQKVSQAEALKRANRYDGAALIASETRRENIRQEQITKYSSRLILQSVLILPLTENVQYSFNPNNLVALDEARTIYPTLKVSDAWGILEVSNGALMIREGSKVVQVRLAAPIDPGRRPLTGEGWTLDLTAGWELSPGERKGDLVLKKTQ